MATMNPPINERRHIPDRRANSMHMTDTHATHVTETSSKRMSAAEWIPMLLLAIGGINWGLIGLFDFNLVSTLFGEMSALTRVIYVAVGLSALYSLYMSARMSSHHD
jgi:uncharacterized membrane protein YuzA (DUF378 family)